MSIPESILVLGAGELGWAVLESLATHPARNGAAIAVLKRGPHASLNPALDKLDIRAQMGDVVAMDVESLAEAFRRYEVVISCNGMTLPPETQIKLAEAAIRAGVKRYFPWQFGLSYDEIGRQSSQNLFDAQLDVRDLLRGQSTMAWVIVSTGIFTSFLFEPSFGIVDRDRNTITALGSWDNRITVTSPVDIGRVVAELVLACPAIDGVVYTAGDTISMEQLADLVDKILGRSVERKIATVDELEAELKAEPDNGSRKYRAVFAAGVGTAWEKKTTFSALRNMSMQTVDQWARDHLL
ncbi:hypothetical protein LTR53_001734 [Teratosphaeriaceae sp. CCFEE 6253]|nr:hypothetical protein LTR53_001734 [Teratosphaeriaceae sp. CCFEE 6253]